MEIRRFRCWFFWSGPPAHTHPPSAVPKWDPPCRAGEDPLSDEVVEGREERHPAAHGEAGDGAMCVPDDALGIDHEHAATVEADGAERPVELTDRLVGVGEQREGETMLGSELLHHLIDVLHAVGSSAHSLQITRA